MLTANLKSYIRKQDPDYFGGEIQSEYRPEVLEYRPEVLEFSQDYPQASTKSKQGQRAGKDKEQAR